MSSIPKQLWKKVPINQINRRQAYNNQNLVIQNDCIKEQSHIQQFQYFCQNIDTTQKFQIELQKLSSDRALKRQYISRYDKSLNAKDTPYRSRNVSTEPQKQQIQKIKYTKKRHAQISENENPFRLLRVQSQCHKFKNFRKQNKNMTKTLLRKVLIESQNLKHNYTNFKKGLTQMIQNYINFLNKSVLDHYQHQIKTLTAQSRADKIELQNKFMWEQIKRLNQDNKILLKKVSQITSVSNLQNSCTLEQQLVRQKYENSQLRKQNRSYQQQIKMLRENICTQQQKLNDSYKKERQYSQCKNNYKKRLIQLEALMNQSINELQISDKKRYLSLREQIIKIKQLNVCQKTSLIKDLGTTIIKMSQSYLDDKQRSSKSYQRPQAVHPIKYTPTFQNQQQKTKGQIQKSFISIKDCDNYRSLNKSNSSLSVSFNKRDSRLKNTVVLQRIQPNKSSNFTLRKQINTENNNLQRKNKIDNLSIKLDKLKSEIKLQLASIL